MTGEIKSFPDTDAIIYDPSSKLVFAFNGDSKNSTVIDPAKGAMVKGLVELHIESVSIFVVPWRGHTHHG